MDGDPYINYSMIGFRFANISKNHFANQFVMQELTDGQARIVFNVGSTAQDIYIDNVVLKEVVTGIRAEENIKPVSFYLWPNRPNPFNSATVIKFTVPQKSIVNIEIFNILGELVKTILNQEKEAGTHQIRFQADLLPSGIYFYRLQARAIRSHDAYKSIKKMIILK
jgi:hypothetical protein